MYSSDLQWLLNSSKDIYQSKYETITNNKLSSLENPSFSIWGGLSLLYEKPYYKKKSEFSSLTSIFDDRIKLEPGSILVVSLGIFLEHTGIYVGDDKVVELYGDGTINLISIREFLFGGYKNDISPRTGLEIFTASFRGKAIHSKEVADRALELIKHRKSITYDIFSNNCHMLSGYCFSGKDFQSNTDCRFFHGLTKIIIDSTLPSDPKNEIAIRELFSSNSSDIFTTRGSWGPKTIPNFKFEESFFEKQLKYFNWSPIDYNY